MITWSFHIDDLEIEEPIGFSDIIIRAKRDENWHGIFFEASTSELSFYGEAAEYLRNKKFTEGFQADVTFRAVATCGEEVDVLEGKLDFRQYKETCGDTCLVKMPVEQTGCTMVLRNRYDQKVDLTTNQSYNGTALEDYAWLNFPMTLPAQETRAAVEGYVAEDTPDVIDLAIFPTTTENFQVRATYAREIYNNINEGQLLPSVFAASDNGISDPILSPILLLDEVLDCFDGDFSYEVRMKGSYDYAYFGLGTIDNVRLVIGYGDPEALTILHTQNLSFSGDEAEGDFDYTFTGTVMLAQEDTFYAYFENLGSYLSASLSGSVTFDPETYVNLNANRSCPETDAVVSLVHEAASRVTEIITDRCLTVKSDYYGRTDSEPYAAAEDGCGSLRVLSSGLRLRNAPNPVHFMSLKDVFDGLKAIDNIGMGVEGTELRIEPVEYFYQDFEIMKMRLVPNAVSQLEPSLAYSIIKIGYKKWETEGINGLDEFNSPKEFRTSLSSIQNTLEAQSDFIAGGYPIEQTRQQSFAELGGADTKYDNDTFIISVIRIGYGYQVEQGNIASATNIYSPDTAYNWRIRPFYNLMRWWKSIAQSYPNITATTSNIFFSSGAGNLLAEGILAVYDECQLENKVKAENDDLSRMDFNTLPLPLWRPETIAINYPFSLRDYNTVKENPYGYISIQCGTGEFVKAFITNLQYKPAKGEADLQLRLKWDTAY